MLKVNFLRKRYRTDLSKTNGNKFAKESDFITFPDSPIKYITIGLSCFTSYSEIACLQAPQGGIGFVVGVFF